MGSVYVKVRNAIYAKTNFNFSVRFKYKVQTKLEFYQHPWTLDSFWNKEKTNIKLYETYS